MVVNRKDDDYLSSQSKNTPPPDNIYYEDTYKTLESKPLVYMSKGNPSVHPHLTDPVSQTYTNRNHLIRLDIKTTKSKNGHHILSTLKRCSGGYDP